MPFFQTADVAFITQLSLPVAELEASAVHGAAQTIVLTSAFVLVHMLMDRWMDIHTQLLYEQET